MNKKLFCVLAATIVVFLGQNVTFADFNAEEFARNFLRSPMVVTGAGDVKRVIDILEYRDQTGLYGAYSSGTSGFVDPNRLGYDVGTFAVLPLDTGQRGLIHGNDIYFSSFALGAAPRLNEETYGRLSYVGGSTQTSGGQAINLGIAYLYQKYATGNLVGYNSTTAAELNEAFQLLLSGSISGAQWTTNRFLSHLSTEIAGTSVWLTPYDLNTSYPWLDNNYAVYVMNLQQWQYDFNPDNPGVIWTSAGDVLYLVRRDGGGSSDVPEPATLLLWTSIGLGMFGVARHRSMKQ